MFQKPIAWFVASLILAACTPLNETHSLAAFSHPSPQSTACEPANGRQGTPGCWVLVTAPVSSSAHTLYWHVYEFPSSVEAQRFASETTRVIEAHGRIWLVTVAEMEWSIGSGRHHASVGPLELLSSVEHTASFMEATFIPGMASRIHTHPGPEAWVVLEGEQCLETPEGVMRGRAGDTVMVRGGIPMALFGTGKEIRKALVLILHPTTEPLGKTHSDWQPTGACMINSHHNP